MNDQKIFLDGIDNQFKVDRPMCPTLPPPTTVASNLTTADATGSTSAGSVSTAATASSVTTPAPVTGKKR